MVFFMLFVLLLMGYMLINRYISSSVWHEFALVFSIGSLLFAIQNCFIFDLRLEKTYLIAISIFQVREIDITNLEVLEINIHRTPYFLLTTNKGKVKVSYTRESYEVLKEIVRINEKNITLEKLERLVKYYFTQLK